MSSKTAVTERPATCVCGCGRELPPRTGRGRPRFYYDDTHKEAHRYFLAKMKGENEQDRNRMG